MVDVWWSRTSPRASRWDSAPAEKPTSIWTTLAENPTSIWTTLADKPTSIWTGGCKKDAELQHISKGIAQVSTSKRPNLSTCPCRLVCGITACERKKLKKKINKKEVPISQGGCQEKKPFCCAPERTSSPLPAQPEPMKRVFTTTWKCMFKMIRHVTALKLNDFDFFKSTPFVTLHFQFPVSQLLPVKI